MLINCVVYQPASEAFVRKLAQSLRRIPYQAKLTVLPAAEQVVTSPFFDGLVRLREYFQPAGADLFLVIHKQAEFFTRGDFLSKTIKAHLEGGWDWTYPTQSIRSFFLQDDWALFSGKTLTQIIARHFIAKEQVLAAPEIRVNSRYLMDLPSIQKFRRHYQAQRPLPEVGDKHAFQLQYWNKRALNYPERGRTGYVGFYRQRELDFIREYFLAGNILDCGCGDGKLLESAQSLCPGSASFWVGFDFAADMLKFANRQKAAFLRMDLKRLAFAPNSFDYIFAVRSIKNLPGWSEQKEALRQISRICKKRLVIIDSFVESYTQPVPVYNYLIPESKMLALLNSQGFRLLEKRYYPEPGRAFDFQKEPVGDEGFFVFDKI